MEKVLILGGSGLLGRNLLKLIDNQKFKVLSPSSKQLNVKNKQQIENFFNTNKVDICIHCAALKNVKKIQTSEKELLDCINVNVVGTANILAECVKRKIKLVFISTDHVFDGKKGNYIPSDSINPITKYAKTKTAAELIVQTYHNSLIIRTSFFDLHFPYEIAYHDQWSTKDYIDIMAPKILKACLSDKIGICHVASKKRSMFELAKIRNSKIQKGSISDNDFIIPRDTSLKETK
jgi:dTDP-4-dehydrorhamnose reductase